MPEIPTAFFKMFILKNHFGGFLLHRRCAPYPDGLGSADFSSARFSGLEEDKKGHGGPLMVFALVRR
jgi:hypothetical protein